MPAQYVLQKTGKGKFYFNLTAENNHVILTSESYNAKSGAQSGINSCQKNAANDARFARLEAKGGKFYFTLKAGNNQVIGTSQMYKSAASRDKGIEAVKRVGPSAGVSDKTS